jgi:hypothetical protein
VLLILAPLMTAIASQFPRLRARPHSSEAVIVDARRRARRRRIATSAFFVAVAAAYLIGGHPGLGANAQNVRHSLSPRETTACLVAQHALVATAQSGPQFLSAPAIHASFALVPGRRLDGMTIYFERSHAAATGVVARLVARLQPSAPFVSSYLTVAKSAIVVWDSPTTSGASRAAALGCL